MPGDPIVIGPFVGGLNNISLAGEARDNEVTELVNFEVGIDTALTSRPPLLVKSGSTLPATVTKNWEILGIYRLTNASWYLIAQKEVNGVYRLYAFPKADLNAGVEIKVFTGTNKASDFVQVDDLCYFVTPPGSTVAGFKWNLSTAATDIAAMPKGNVMVSHKSRLWIAGTDVASTNSTIWFSTIDSGGPKFDTWNTSVDFFKVAPGEGGFITSILSLNSSILIFKDDGTWRFSYARSPKEGQVDKVSGYIGASSKTSVVEFENLVYVYDKGRVYELINSVYNLINRTVDFSYDGSSVSNDVNSVDVSITSRRLIIRFRNALYVYNLDTKTWSQWRSYNGVPGRFFELPQDLTTSDPSKYLAASASTTQSAAVSFLSDPSFTQDKTLERINANLPSGVTASKIGGGFLVTTEAVSDFSVALNGTGEYDIPVSSGQKIKVKLSPNFSGGTVAVRAKYLHLDGTESISASQALTSQVTATEDKVFAVPDQAVQAYFELVFTSATYVTVRSVDIRNSEEASPKTLIELTDYYPESINMVELIECSVKTKAYDYKAPSVHKRLFWWGIDHRSFLTYSTRAVPITRKRPPLWKDLEAYTWNQLSQGTWENPLSFLGISTAISDSSNVSSTQTSNGRIFSKIKKAMRFRQMSYEVSMITHGNKRTGPCKIFSLTTYVQPKQKVVDKNS